MCYVVKCGSCGKSSWAGCGMHVASVYRQIQEGQHCQCKSWPGVKMASGGTPAAAEEAPASSCTIL